MSFVFYNTQKSHPAIIQKMAPLERDRKAGKINE